MNYRDRYENEQSEATRYDGNNESSMFPYELDDDPVLMGVDYTRPLGETTTTRASTFMGGDVEITYTDNETGEESVIRGRITSMSIDSDAGEPARTILEGITTNRRDFSAEFTTE